MKLRNKKTGEIRNCQIIADGLFIINSLADLEEWEDYEEPKGYWYINEFGTPTEITHTRENIYDTQRKNFGNYFETKEEAEKAVEKLKAWKRLKDKGFRFTSWDDASGATIRHKDVIVHKFTAVMPDDCSDYSDDLDLLFGGEE